jgi:hypothetical protein
MRMGHFKKCRKKHWLTGFYTPGGEGLRITRYPSLQMMEPWNSENDDCIDRDFKSAPKVPALGTMQRARNFLEEEEM